MGDDGYYRLCSATFLTAVNMNWYEGEAERTSLGGFMSVNAKGWDSTRAGRSGAGGSDGPMPLARRVPGATLARLAASDPDPDRAERLIRPVAPQEALHSILEFDIDLDHLMRSAIWTVQGGHGVGFSDAGGESDE